MEDDADDITPPRPSELSSSLAVRAAEWGLEGHGPPETTDSRPASASSHTISRAFGKAGEARRGVHDREGVRRPVKPSFRGLVQKKARCGGDFHPPFAPIFSIFSFFRDNSTTIKVSK